MKTKRILSCLLVLALLFSLLPVAAYADGPAFETIIGVETFEDGSIPSGWTTTPAAGNYRWTVNKGIYENGSVHNDGMNAYVAHYRYSEYARAYLIMPAVDLSGYCGARISCCYINPMWGSAYDEFGICYRINGGEWVTVYHTLDAHGSWTDLTVSLPKAAMTSGVQIAFRTRCIPGKYGSGVGLDDVSLEATTTPCTVTYDGNGGTGTMTDPNNPYGCGCSVPTLLSTFTPPADKAFTGWNTQSDGTGTYYPAGSSFDIAANTTLYAQWGDPVTYAIPTLSGTEVTGSTAASLAAYAVVTDQTVWSETVSGGWYAVDKNVTVEGRIRIDGDVKLVLCDGAQLTAADGIELQGDANSLTIYAGTLGNGAIAGTGTLLAGTSDGVNGTSTSTGIGSSHAVDDSEIGYERVHLTINGGRIVAFSGSWSAGIGGAANCAGGTITINGGDVTAVSTHYGAGVGGGSTAGRMGAKDLQIFVNGGTVTGTGNNGGHAIGTGTSGMDVPVYLYPQARVSVDGTPVASGERYNALKRNNTPVKVEPCTAHSMEDGHCLYCDYIEATVTYDGNGATGGSAPTDTLYQGSSGATVILPGANTLVKSGGFIFAGWNTKTDGSGTPYAAGDPFPVTRDVTLYAQWQPTHTHSFTYTANGATITASCTAGCDITTGLTLTVSAPEGNPVYDGATSYPATLNDDYNTTAFPGTYTVSYTRDGAAFTGNPTEAGTYVASVTAGEGDAAVTASVTYTIAPIGGLTVSLNGSAYTYNNEPHAIANAPTTNAISGTTTYTYSFDQSGPYVDDLTSLTKTAAGTYTVYVRATNPNYSNMATTTATLTVNPANPTANAPSATATYGQTLSSITLQNPTGNTAGTWSWANPDQSVGNAGTNTFKATFTPSDTANYNTLTDLDVEVTVNPKAVTVTADAKTKVYDNDASTDPTLTATVTGVVEGDTLNYTLSRAEGQNVDEYDITVTLGENPNYTVTATGAKFTITPKMVTVTADAKTKVYDNDASTDPALTATVTGVVEGDTLNYTLSRAEGQDVDEYDITVTLGENPNYTVTATGAKFTITPKAASVTADAKSKEYGTADPTLTAQVEGVVEGDKLNYTLSRAEGENAGEYDITVTLGDNPNYDVTATNAKLTITAATPELTDVLATAITYGDTLAQSTVTGTATNPNNGANVAGTWAFTNGETVPEVADSNTTEYSVTFTPTDTANYESATTTVKLTVNKAKPAFTAPTAKELVNTGEAQELVNAGATEDGTMLYSLDGENFSEAIPTATALGTYTVWYMVQGDANHLDTEPASLEVTIRLTICGSNDSSLALAFVENGKRLYRYDVMIKNIPEDFNAVGMQVFLNYDNALLTLRRVENGAVEWTHYEKNNTLLFAWAGDTPVTLENDEVLFSLVFAASDDAAGAETALPFTVNAHGAVSAVSAAEDGKVVEYVAATVDGMIRFATPVWGDAKCRVDDGSGTQPQPRRPAV